MLIPMAPLVLAAGCRHGHCHHGEMNADQMAERFKDGAETILDEVDATDAQTRAVNAIVERLARDLAPMHKEHGDLKAQLHKALSAEQVDRQELERVRRQALDLIDRASARALDALAEGSAVLTVEQRRELASHWRRHGH
jgi:Spy/CpxP family protein refolding chaperone